MRKPSSVGILLVVVLFVGTKQSCLGGNSTSGCIETERQALLSFKQSLTDPSRRLSSWNSTDCCTWNGVFCDGSSDRVVKLDLRNVNISTEEEFSYPFHTNALQGGEVNSCLLELKYLNYLDLSHNDFQDSPIPKFFGSMTLLKYLNLSAAHFSGIVPHHLGNLSSLCALDLSPNYWGALIVDDLAWLSHLSSLQRLQMSGANLTQARNLIEVLNMLPLLELGLSGCGLDNIHGHASVNVNSTLANNLQYLDLSYNSFEGKLPSLLANMTSLRLLHLSSAGFNSSIPLFMANFKSLVHLNLGDNRFNRIEGGLQTILSNLCHMKTFVLSGNIVQGEMISTDGNFSGCIEYALEKLKLSSNKFSGHLPDWLGQFKRLKQLGLDSNLFNGSIPESLGRLSELIELELSDNQLIGAIPVSIGSLTDLRVLRLSYNKLNGNIPVALGQLSKLEILEISSNSLEGVVSEAHLANLSKLEYMSTSLNPLTFKVSSEWIPPFQLTYIYMGSCKVGPQFPQWFRTQKELVRLELSNASISGTLPRWLRDLPISEIDLSHNLISGPLSNIPSNITIINLSDNLISGSLPHNISDMMPALRSLLLADNLLIGSIPNSLCQIIYIQAIDLSRNRLSGNIPDCWKDVNELGLLKLSSNMLSGEFPSSLGYSSLSWLHLNNNSFQGELPLGLRNCQLLQVLDLGENGFSGNIPKWIGENLSNLRVLRLHKNNFNGSIPSQLCQLPRLQIMDLAGNDLTQTIPRCFGNLSGMYIRSRFLFDTEWLGERVMAVMKGVELEYTTTLVFVVNMDLSSNKLVGKIPEELTALSELLGLNLSNNQLTGSIPIKIGDMKSLISLDFSSNHLSGMIPQSMAALTSMSHLNLSYNNFSGEIPTGHQLQTLDDPSIYIANSELCGSPLPKKCTKDESSQDQTTTSHDDEHDVSEKVWFYIDIMSGFATGFWGVVGVLFFQKSWRHAYFKFLDMTKDRILVAIEVRVARMKRGRTHTDG